MKHWGVGWLTKRGMWNGVSASSSGSSPEVSALFIDEIWRSTVFIMFKSFLAILLPFYLLIYVFSSLSLIFSPLIVINNGQVEFWEIWTINTIPESLIAVVLGFILLITIFYINNKITNITKDIANQLL